MSWAITCNILKDQDASTRLNEACSDWQRNQPLYKEDIEAAKQAAKAIVEVFNERPVGINMHGYSNEEGRKLIAMTVAYTS